MLSSAIIYIIYLNVEYIMILSNEYNIDETYEYHYEKEVIKVFVITGPTTSGIVTHVSEVNGQKVYSGMLWDITEAIKKLPDFKKYKFEYTFSEPGYNNYNETVDWVGTGKYDLGLAWYSQTFIREGKINYTVPISIDAYALYHYSNTNWIYIYKDVLLKIGHLLGISIVLGIISGIILFFIDPKRIASINNKNRKMFFIRSITTGVATFFGEAGFLFENSSSSVKGIVAVTMIMLLAVVFLQFMQAEITSFLIKRKMDNDVTDLDIRTKKAIGHYGYSHTTKWEERGGIVKRFKGKTNMELIEIYKKDMNKYIGVVLSYYDGFPFLDVYPGITASVFGNTPVCMIYNPSKVKFGEDLNKGLLYIRATEETKKICKYYFGTASSSAPPACTL
jgi:hypothetical protein